MQTAQVVIVGAGPAGLMSAFLLARFDIKVTLIEHHASTSTHPKARGLNLRTMEILRACGLEGRVLSAGSSLAKNKFMLFVETLAGREFRRIPDDDLMMHGELLRRWTPCTWTQCSQDQFERVLAEAARDAGADLRFASDLVNFTQDETGVHCVVRDLESGRVYEVHADYLLACDGSNSFVRCALNIALKGRSAIENFVNIYFQADLKPLVEGRWFGICFVENLALRGLFLPVDNDSRWLLNIQFDPETTPLSSFTADRCLELVRSAVGDPSLSVDILSAIPWQASALVAAQMCSGRTFLVGDSAHIMPPAGAFGLNTAVQDAHNLAWKLAAVLKGEAGESLLESYELERMPIARDLAREAERQMDEPNPWDGGGDAAPAWEQEARPANDEAEASSPWDQPLEEQVQAVIGFHYRSDAVAESEPVRGLNLQCQSGTRFPHAWLRDGRSTLDLLTSTFTAVLPAGAEIPASLPGAVQLVELPAAVWSEITASDCPGAVLVRPDGVVAAQCSPHQLTSVYNTLTAAPVTQSC